MHPINGFSTDEKVQRIVTKYVDRATRVLAMLDSDHGEANVLAKLEVYSKYVSEGSYIIAEDTWIPIARAAVCSCDT